MDFPRDCVEKSISPNFQSFKMWNAIWSKIVRCKGAVEPSRRLNGSNQGAESTFSRCHRILERVHFAPCADFVPLSAASRARNPKDKSIAIVYQRVTRATRKPSVLPAYPMSAVWRRDHSFPPVSVVSPLFIPPAKPDKAWSPWRVSRGDTDREDWVQTVFLEQSERCY